MTSQVGSPLWAFKFYRVEGEDTVVINFPERFTMASSSVTVELTSSGSACVLPPPLRISAFDTVIIKVLPMTSTAREAVRIEAVPSLARSIRRR